jgi:hypothetical protein
MSKFICTLSLFVLALAALICSCVIQVPDPLNAGHTISIILPILGGACCVVTCVYGCCLLWMGCELACGSLRNRFLPEAGPSRRTRPEATP